MNDKLEVKIFFSPIVIILAALGARQLLPDSWGGARPMGDVLEAVIWFASVSLLNRAIHLFFWRPLREVRKVVVPGMLVNLVTGILWLVTFVLVLDVVFRQPITGILTTSTVAMAVGGLALRDFIADLFAGILISIERTVRIGDWIDVDGKYVGRVVEISSRSTRLINRDELTLIVPNSQITRFPVRNHSLPEPYWRDRMTITLGYEVSFYQARRILFSAIQSIPELAAVPRRPLLTVAEFVDRGIVWSLQFWLPDYGARGPLTSRLHQAILRGLHYSGVRCPYPQIINTMDQVPFSATSGDGLVELLRKVSLFAPLTEEELREIADDAGRRTYASEAVIIRQGDTESAHLYILHEGLLEARLDGNPVGKLLAGDVFGEMSLLTGAPRGTTVVALVDSSVLEVPRDVMDRLLRGRPEIASAMGRILAERQLANQRARDGVSPDPVIEEEAKQTLAAQIAGRICGFLGIR
ncbi:MAG: mechanosensitive ion channel family protein [Magnetococcales bacterium]|nr:mechanosensitive ion channel family protein [Magnetococcales bacterium]